MFCKTRLECIQNLAEEMQSNHTLSQITIEGFTPLHYVVKNCYAFDDESYAMELFKNIFEAMEDKNPKDEFGQTPLHRATWFAQNPTHSIRRLKATGTFHEDCG